MLDVRHPPRHARRRGRAARAVRRGRRVDGRARPDRASGATARSPSGRRLARACTRWPSTRACGSPSAAATPLGALIVGARPPHVAADRPPELYVELLISSRAHAGNGIGGRLVRLADEIAVGARRRRPARRLLGRGADARRLVRARRASPRAGTFDFRGWTGQVFEKAIPARVRPPGVSRRDAPQRARTSGRARAPRRSSAAAAIRRARLERRRELGHAGRADVARAALEPVREAAHLVAVAGGERRAQLAEVAAAVVA